MASLNLFTQNRAAIEQLVQDTVSYMVDQFGQSRTSFTVASAYGQILFVLENLAQLILFYIEDSITELNINTATRVSSVRALGQLAGHNPTRAMAATGEVNLIAVTPATNQVAGAVVIIPNYTRIKCLNNGLTYMLELSGDEVRLPTDGSANTVGFKLTQGQIASVPFTGTGLPLQSFSVNSSQGSLIDHYQVTVYVNGIPWKNVDSLLDMPYQANVCWVRTALISGGVDVIFGNGPLGAMPPKGSTIVVEYLTTGGQSGNIFLADGENAIFQWVDSGLDQFGDEVDLNQTYSIVSTFAPNFGSDPEPVALTRLVAPRQSRSFVLANSDNYIVFFEKFNQFSIIDAYTKDDPANPDDRITYLFLIPDVSKRMLSNETYFTVPESRFILTPIEQSKIMDLIDRSGSMIITTELSFVQPIITRYVLNIALIIYQGAGYPSEDVIRQSILSKLSTYFINVRRRDRIPRSDLIAIIESVPGVDSVNLTALSQDDEAAITVDPTYTPQQIDEFGDLVIQSDQIAIIRGGWADRRGLSYEAGLDPEKPSCVNIVVKQVVNQTYNSVVNDQTVNSIINNNS